MNLGCDTPPSSWLYFYFSWLVLTTVFCPFPYKEHLLFYCYITFPLVLDRTLSFGNVNRFNLDDVSYNAHPNKKFAFSYNAQPNKKLVFSYNAHPNKKFVFYNALPNKKFVLPYNLYPFVIIILPL